MSHLAHAIDFFQSARQRASQNVQKSSKDLGSVSQNIITDDQLVLELRVENSYPGDLSSDGLQALSYDELSQESSSRLSGIPISKLSLWTSSHDTLNTYPNSLIQDPEFHFKEVPLIKKDLNTNGVFDSGDSIYFYGHGSSFWKRLSTDFGPLKFHLSHSPYGYGQSYYLGMLSSGEGLEVEVVSASAFTHDVSDSIWYYRHAEREMVLRDFTFETIDDSTGVEWHWIYFDSEDASSYEVSHPQTDNLVAPGDSAYAWLKFFPLRRKGSSQAGYRALETNRFVNTEYQLFINNKDQKSVGDTQYEGHFLFELSDLGVDNKYNVQVFDIEQGRGLAADSRFDAYTISWKGPFQRDPLNPYVLPHNSSGALKLPEGDFELFRIRAGQLSAQISATSEGYVDPGYEEGDYYYLHTSSKNEVTISQLPDYQTSLDVSPQTEYLIITPHQFYSPSADLASLRNSGVLVGRFNTQVVEVEQIFQKYSGGRPSPAAIRNYLQNLHNQPNSELKYVLLVGDTHYDFRNIRGLNVELNVPTFEAEELATDDYFTALDAGERISASNYTIDLSVGRLPIRIQDDFQNYLLKIKKYSQLGQMATGSWRNQVLFGADDFKQREWLEVESMAVRHTNSSERLATTINEVRGSSDESKIYLVDYEVNSNFEKPVAYRDLIRKLNQGQRAFNFFGHGGVDQLADETFMDESSITLLDNIEGLPVMSAFSCQVGRIDRIEGTSLAQEVMLYGEDGAIAFVAGTRNSYPTPNEKLSLGFYSRLFNTDSSITIGEALRLAKSEYSNVNNTRDNANSEKYNIFGEPVITFTSEKLTIQFDSLPDTLQALQKVQLSGTVTGTTSDGQILLKVIEQSNTREYSESGLTSIGNSSSPSVTIDEPGRTLYAEVLDFKDGKFATEFYTPRKLSFGDTNAVLRAYAWKPQYPDEGSFFKEGIQLNGTSADASEIDDQEAPVVKAYPCDVEVSETGYYQDLIEQSNPACIEFEVLDSTGIDFSEAVDEGVTLEVESLYPRQHASFEKLSGNRATFRIDLGDASPPGEYQVEVRALDILGNYSSKQWKLKLSGQEQQSLSEVYNVPNPMKSHTRFFFKTASNASVSVKIFDQRGYMVAKLNNVRSGDTQWNGRDSRGHLLANGLYFYKVYSSSQKGGQTTSTESRVQKLVISR